MSVEGTQFRPLVDFFSSDTRRFETTTSTVSSATVQHRLTDEGENTETNGAKEIKANRPVVRNALADLFSENIYELAKLILGAGATRSEIDSLKGMIFSNKNSVHSGKNTVQGAPGDAEIPLNIPIPKLPCSPLLIS